MHSGEATHTNFKVFDLTRPGLELKIYHTRGEHANQYTTDAVNPQCDKGHKVNKPQDELEKQKLQSNFL